MPWVLFGSWTLLSTLAKGETDARFLPQMKEKMQTLRYPALPSRDLSPRVPTSVGFKRPNEWSLASIGFFKLFNSLLQPIDPKTSACRKSVVVAVIDTGIDYTHPDLVDSLWTNRLETGPWMPPEGNHSTCRDLSCNGIDDDTNGFIDDAIGWDFIHSIPAPYDTLGHGTHIAGIIAGAGHTSQLGVCPGVSIMPLKYYDPLGPGPNNLGNLVKAIHYANINGADIINFSGGGVEPAESELRALQAAEQMGVLVVTAAGNQGRSNDLFGSFPANYSLSNIVSVAAIDSKGNLLSSSNYGKRVHLAAPGLDILSTAPQSASAQLTGTSQATAFVTGAAAFLMSQDTVDYAKVKSWLTRGAKPLPAGENKSALGHGILSLPDSYQLLKEESLGKRENR